MCQNILITKIKRSLVSDNLFQVLRDKGLNYVIRTSCRMLFNWSINYYYYKYFKFHLRFKFLDKEYAYFNHRYHETLRNERAIEIPIALDLLEQYKGKQILEIGNVLSHYYTVQHDIVDKYEKADGVINADVIDFQSDKKYDLILSISTLEHVGWDEIPKQADKIPRGIENIAKYLNSNGLFFMTMPVGVNPYLDQYIENNELPVTKKYFMKRITRDNQWLESNWNDVKNLKYDTIYPCANALFIGIIENKSI